MPVSPDIWQNFPAALAFLAFGFFEHNAHAFDFRQTEGLGRGRVAGQLQARRDAQVVHVDLFQQLARFDVVHMYDRGCLEAGADHLVGPLNLQRGSHHPAHPADAGDGSHQRFVQPVGWGVRNIYKVDRAFVARVPFQPDLFHRENKDWGQPGGQPVEKDIQNRTGAAAAQRVTIAIERVLADIEVECRQINGCEIEHCAENALKIEGAVTFAYRHVQLGQFAQHPAFQRWHVRRRGPVTF